MDEEIALERDSIERGIARYKEMLKGNEARGRKYEDTASNRLFKDAMKRLIPEVRKDILEAMKKTHRAQTVGSRLAGWELKLQALSAEQIAYIALKCVLVGFKVDYKIQGACMSVGNSLNLEVRWQELRAGERDAAKAEDRPNRITQMKHHVREVNPRSVKKWLKDIEDISTTVWSKSDQFKIGAVCVAAVLRACPDIIVAKNIMSTKAHGAHTPKVLTLTPEFVEKLAEGQTFEANDSPWMVPMICEPKPWAKVRGKWEGGYLLHEHTIVKETKGFNHTTSEGVSATVVNALNTVQSTPWNINTAVLDVLSEAIDRHEGPLPVEPLMDFPEAVPADEWAKMNREARGARKRVREEVHSHNNRQIAKGLAMTRIVNVATKFAGRDIWFPHNIDWRGRVYPLPQDLHPQGDDMTKGLLTFAKGKPLGEHGMKWLVFHLANCYGMDKVDRQGQADWYNENLHHVYNVASDPFGSGLEFWSGADEPWQFLAACIEVCRAADDPEGYVSHLPVNVDGSCNGLQHLSAMGLDPVGAHAVNLTADPVRQDIYQIVADKVVSAISKDAHSTSPEDWPCSHAWEGKVTRKTVKRGVMTTPYGVTSIGMRDQLLKDRMCEDLEGDPMLNANYLRDKMQDGIASTIVKGMEIMLWFQQCAEILAKDGKPISWTTPVGLRVTQNYQQREQTRIRTLVGLLILQGKGVGLPKRLKQKLSIAPNLIHSFDAAHMMMAVLEADKMPGADMSFSVIHDSFGCHAADMEDFNKIIRVTFRDIYKTNYFRNLTDDFHKQGIPEMPEVPERGLFDIDEVLDAEFFFA